MEELKKESTTCYLIAFWVKAILHNWNALTNMLKDEKNMSQADIDNIHLLGNHL